MSSKIFKKMLAGMLALTMVLGMSTTAFAATSGSTTSDGKFEGHVNKNIVEVMLPTVDATSDVFAFTMDPEGLIEATANEKYPDATFEGDTGVYFLSAEDTYTKDSAKLKVTNTGTVDVDVTLTAQATVDEGITVADAAEFDGSAAAVYLGLVVDGTVAEGTPVEELAVNGSDADEAASRIVGLKGRDANYEIAVSDGEYVYAKKDDIADTAWNSFEFGLTGACDQEADWSEVSTEDTSVTVTWAYAAAVSQNAANMLDENAIDAPVVPADEEPEMDTEVTYSGEGDLVIAYKLGTGELKVADEITDVMIGFDGAFYSINGSWDSTETADVFTITEDEIVISGAGWMAYYDAGEYELFVEYDDNEDNYETITITVE